MELKIANTKKKIELSDDVFGCEFNQSLVHQIVTAYMNAGRAGTKAQKTRAEVRGGGVKPWRQKGTGQARAGTITSPIWRTGGRTFAAKPRCYKQKVNKKMHKGAIRSILSELIRQERIQIVDKFEVSSNKTKDLVKKLNDMKVDGHIMIIADDVQEDLYLAARNLHRIALSDASATVTDPVSLVRAEKIIATEAAMKELEELLK